MTESVGFSPHGNRQFSAGTTAVASDKPKIDLAKISKVIASFHDSLAKSFTGIPVLLDPCLDGMSYCMRVSPALWAEIQKNPVIDPESRQLVDKLKI